MDLIFIYGLPATGKLTVGRELAVRTGFRLFHNHLAVDLLLSVFEFGSPSFVDLREKIWLSVFGKACAAGLPGLIFTFTPEVTVRPNFVPEVQRILAMENGRVHFVELVCPPAELKRRLDSPSRLQFGKLTSVPIFEQLQSNGTFSASQMPAPRLSIDTGLCSPAQAAAQIAQTLFRQPAIV